MFCGKQQIFPHQESLIIKVYQRRRQSCIKQCIFACYIKTKDDENFVLLMRTKNKLTTADGDIIVIS